MATQRPLKTRFGMTVAERTALGKSRRKFVRRIDQASWDAPSDRPDPVALIRKANVGRLPALLPIKFRRMAFSPFGFFRGAAPVMAHDLAGLPTTGLTSQICGDAHVRNLGAYAAPDGHLVFDINDFDETLPGPWEWDLKRLATSFVLAGREAGDSDDRCVEAVRKLVQTYRERIEAFSQMSPLELARYEVTRDIARGPVEDVLSKAERATRDHAFQKLSLRGRARFHDRPPLLHHVSDFIARLVIRSLGSYRDTLGPDRQLVLDAYRPADVAFKIVGTGSVGTRDYVVLLLGIHPNDPLLLQVKEEPTSCYAPYLPDLSIEHQGRRVAEGQHRMQTVSDPFLGWTTIGSRDYLVRQLCDHKASVDPTELHGKALLSYGSVCGEIFAKAHARTGDGAAIAGYCGRSPRLDKALASFARAYADQSTADHTRFVKALRSRRRPSAPRGKENASKAKPVLE
jgi:uncharacterized protein (DUF2252 family)